MNIEQAEVLGNSYTEAMGEVLPGIRLGIRNGKDFQEVFYFDFYFLKINGELPDEPIYAGGAPGITIDKMTTEVKVASWARLHELNGEKS